MSLRYSIYKVQTCSFCSFSCPPRTFICYHILSNLSSTFFKFFQILFDVRCAPDRSRSSHNFLSLSQDNRFVKNFFLFFRFSFDFLVARRQLAYTSTPLPFCQALFYKFCTFFLVVLLCVHLSFSAGQTAADLRQRISCVDAGLLFHCQISQTHHTTESSVLHYR